MKTFKNLVLEGVVKPKDQGKVHVVTYNAKHGDSYHHSLPMEASQLIRQHLKAASARFSDTLDAFDIHDEHAKVINYALSKRIPRENLHNFHTGGKGFHCFNPDDKTHYGFGHSSNEALTKVREGIVPDPTK